MLSCKMRVNFFTQKHAGLSLKSHLVAGFNGMVYFDVIYIVSIKDLK